MSEKEAQINKVRIDMKKYGFIGMGNMAKALAAGFIGKGALKEGQISAFAPNQEKLVQNAEKIGFEAMATVEGVIRNSDVIIMACKPYQIEGVLKQTADLWEGKVLLSVAAGWDHARYTACMKELGILKEDETDSQNDPAVRIQFIMPNTPALVAEGIFLFEEKTSLTEEELEEVKALFATLGIVEMMPTHLMGIGGAVCGCTPAYVDMFIEAYADAAVKYGIQRQTAYRLISQMVLGSAKLQQETGLHPGILKDQVCSPGGTTIRGVAALEKNGFRNACIASIDEIMSAK